MAYQIGKIYKITGDGREIIAEYIGSDHYAMAGKKVPAFQPVRTLSGETFDLERPVIPGPNAKVEPWKE